MEINEIKDKNIWEDFLQECEEKTFLPSWNWGEFCKKEGNAIWRWGIYDNNALVSIVFFYKIQARRGTFLFVPHGPNLKKQAINNKQQVLEILFGQLKEIAKEEKADFIRIAPIWEKNSTRNATHSVAGGEENTKLFRDLGFRDAPIHIHPELTWELDITLSEEKLLNQMRKTTRYLIKQAQKNIDVKIIESRKLEDVEKFNELNKKTVDRHHFVPFPATYLKNEFIVFSSDSQPIQQTQGCSGYPEGQILIFLGEYEKELVSCGVFVFWQGIAFYHHGASSLKHPKIPVSYLLIWEAIKEAKKRGCKKFNFWGITEENWKLKIGNWKIGQHPWAGLSLFKTGFGGYKKQYVKTQDLPLSNKYWLTYFFEKIRKIKRGL